MISSSSRQSRTIPDVTKGYSTSWAVFRLMTIMAETCFIIFAIHGTCTKGKGLCKTNKILWPVDTNILGLLALALPVVIGTAQLNTRCWLAESPMQGLRTKATVGAFKSKWVNVHSILVAVGFCLLPLVTEAISRREKLSKFDQSLALKFVWLPLFMGIAAAGYSSCETRPFNPAMESPGALLLDQLLKQFMIA
eukprot:gene20011-7103_t